MQSLVQLEESLAVRPHSIEINEALADAYAKQGRWEEAIQRYQTLLSLYPTTASLFVNRIRLGAAALAISSLFVLAAGLLHPPLANWNLHPVAFAQTLSSTPYLIAQILLLAAFPLFSTAAISIYKLLSYTQDHHPAFWAMVICVLGVGLAMPSLGVNAIFLPLIGHLYLEGELETFNIYAAAQEMPWLLILHAGRYVFVLGIVLFCWVILRNKNFPKWSAILFLVGWMVSSIPAENITRLEMILTGLLISLGGIGLARGVWTQAPLQFRPITDAT